MFDSAEQSSLPAEASDKDLIDAMANGNTVALDMLYDRHGPMLLGYLIGQLRNNRQLAEEVLQDVMLAAWQSAARFRGDSKVKTWLIAIARNQAINIRRKRRLQWVELNETYDSDSTGPLEKVARQSRAERLHQALQQLPHAQRETLELVFFHQLSGPEAAQILEVSVGTVKSRLHRGKETLRRLLGNEDLF